MELKKSTQGPATVVAVTGRIDASTSPEMEKYVVGLIDAGERKLVLDFTGLEYTSSAGLRVLLVVTKKMKALQGRFIIAAMNERIREVIEIAGFTAILQIQPTVDAAVQAIA